jgi:hypothetical protein
MFHILARLPALEKGAASSLPLWNQRFSTLIMPL